MAVRRHMDIDGRRTRSIQDSMTQKGDDLADHPHRQQRDKLLMIVFRSYLVATQSG